MMRNLFRPSGRHLRGAPGGSRFPAWPVALILLASMVAGPALLMAAQEAPPAPAQAAGAAAGKVKEVTVSKTPYATNIEALIDGKIENYNSFKLNDPFRIVVDVWGVAQGGAAPEIAVDTPQVKTVRFSQQEGKLRLLVETPEDRPLPFLVSAEGGKLVLSVGGGPEGKVTSLDRVKEGAPAAKGPAVVGIDLEDLPGTSNVLVTTSGTVPYQVAKKDGLVTLIFAGASAEKGLLRTVDTGKFRIPVRKIVPSASKKGIKVAISFSPGAEYSIDKKDNGVAVSFPKKDQPGTPAVVAKVTENKDEPAPGTGATAEPAGDAGNGGEPGKEKPAPRWGFVTSDTQTRGRYVGQRISLDFKDADLVNVFRIIAEVSNLNIITADEVKGKVTLRLINVPWDQALDMVLRSKSLGVAQEGNVLRIAPLSSIRAEEKARLDAQKETEKLKVTLEAVTETVPVSYSKASELQGKVKNLLSEGGKVEVDDRTNTLIIRDLRRNLDDAKELIAKLDTATPQVLIEARIVEVDTTFSRELGVQWGGAWKTDGSNKIGITGSQDSVGVANPGVPLTNTTPFTTTLPPVSYVANLPASIGLNKGGGISFGILRDNLRLDLSLSAAEAAGKGKVISSPKVVTIDNKEATIEQGTQIPYSTVSASGTNTQFIDATLSLKVTPHITPDGGVVMKLEAKNDSQGEVGASGQPAINKKKAITEVLIRDGETAVIGGILQVSRKEDQTGLPWLSKIPVLGHLFRKDTNSATNRELLIFITPKILKPEPAQAKAS